jgi:hypothetical protein
MALNITLLPEDIIFNICKYLYIEDLNNFRQIKNQKIHKLCKTNKKYIITNCYDNYIDIYYDIVKKNKIDKDYLYNLCKDDIIIYMSNTYNNICVNLDNKKKVSLTITDTSHLHELMTLKNVIRKLEIYFFKSDTINYGLQFLIQNKIKLNILKITGNYVENINDVNLNIINNISLLYLDLSNNDFLSIPNFTNVAYLDLSNCRNITDISHLKNNKNLLGLNISGCYNITTDISEFKYLKQLNIAYTPNIKYTIEYLNTIEYLTISCRFKKNNNIKHFILNQNDTKLKQYLKHVCCIQHDNDYTRHKFCFVCNNTVF